MRFHPIGLILAFSFLLLFAFCAWLKNRGASRRFFWASHLPFWPATSKIRQFRARIPRIFSRLGFLCLLIALARPQEGLEKVNISQKGFAMMLVMDRSGSMVDQRAMTTYRNQKMSKLDAVKKILASFVLGGDGFAGRKSDLIGVVSFAAFAEENCPMTFEHDDLTAILKEIPAADPEEDGTAIGDAIQYATLVMESFFDLDKDQLEQDDYQIKDKVMILLTDGQNNYGQSLPVDAAKYAKSKGIRIYTIGVQDTAEILPSIFRMNMPESGFQELEAVSAETGGQFFTAKNGEEINQIYQKIDSLERSEFKQVTVSYRELFPFFLIAGLVLLALGNLLNAVWIRNYLED